MRLFNGCSRTETYLDVLGATSPSLGSLLAEFYQLAYRGEELLDTGLVDGGASDLDDEAAIRMVHELAAANHL